MSRLLMYGRFAAGLPEFLRQRMTLDQAKATLGQRLASRESNFVDLARRTVFRNPHSPYRFIMRDAGCEPGDVEELVTSEGLDAALVKLERSGIRISFEEFKGRSPLVRGGRTFEVGPASFDNPLGKRSIVTQTTGSTGRPTRVNMELDHIAAMCAGRMLVQHANGVAGCPTVIYRAGLPSTAAVGNILSHVVIGNPVRRWFSPLGAGETGAPARFRIAGAILPVMARLSGQPFPGMEVVPISEAVRIARVAAEFAQDEGSCLVRCAISTSLAVSKLAMQAGIDMTGVTFMGAAEPATPAKVRGLLQSGASYVTNYAMNEAGMMGGGCARGADQTDVHIWRDSIAVVPGSRVPEAGELSMVSFAVTSLLTTAPKIMINVDIDDYGLLENRQCGCALGELGLQQHARQIRSSAKLTGRGVTLTGSDVVRVIEEVLPARFGGQAQDYQLVEEEIAGGETMLTLLIDPAITIADERAAAALLLEALSAGRPGARFSSAILRGAEAVRVRREKPVPNARGKQPAFRTSYSSS